MSVSTKEAEANWLEASQMSLLFGPGDIDLAKLTLNDFQGRAIHTARYQERPESASWLFDRTGEEMLELAGKLVDYESFEAIRDNPEALRGVLQECGDTLWFVSETARMFEFPLGDLVAHEMEKRRLRWEFNEAVARKYTESVINDFSEHDVEGDEDEDDEHGGLHEPDPRLDDLQKVLLPMSLLALTFLPTPADWAKNIKDRVRFFFNSEPKQFSEGLWSALNDVVDLANILGIPLSQIAELNFVKTTSRAERNVVFGQGDDR